MSLSSDYVHTLGIQEPRFININPEIDRTCDPSFPGALQTTNPAYPTTCPRGAGTRLLDTAFLAAGMPPVVHGKQAIWTAIEFKHPEVVKLLIDAGANVNEAGEYGQTMVMLASDHKNLEILNLLIQAGADVNRPNDYKIAPLASAAEQGNKEIVEALIKAGANVNARNTYGGTALQVAVMRGSIDIVKMLIDSGADVARDRAELLEIAKREKHTEIEKLIREARKK